MAHYILWGDRIHTDPPTCVNNPSNITGTSRRVEGFDYDNEFCAICFKGRSIVKCKNCPKTFFSILPEKVTLLGTEYDLAELDKKIHSEVQFSDKAKLVAELDGFAMSITCPACKQIHPYTVSDVKII